MSKIDELIKNAEKQLIGKIMTLKEMDNKIQELLRTRNSVFDKLKEWIINVDNGITIRYSFSKEGRYRIYITFMICEEKRDRMIDNAKVEILKIEKI